jgi:hypothetical protein
VTDEHQKTRSSRAWTGHAEEWTASSDQEVKIPTPNVEHTATLGWGTRLLSYRKTLPSVTPRDILNNVTKINRN